MTQEELQRKIEELKSDHIAAGGFISHEEAEQIINEVYGLGLCKKRGTPSQPLHPQGENNKGSETAEP